MASKKTLVLGSSTNPSRYSHLAVRKLVQYGHEVIAVGRKPGQILSVEIQTGMPPAEGVDTVTLYLNPVNQCPFHDYILGLKPRRIIFNPGTENPELKSLAEAAGIETLAACTLVMLSTGIY
ncbi:MAG: CoA-binding protein [Verrucomicrobiales bacterium]|nr:CoA-binding protein [Verrucomicrobiales bacterium]